MNQKGFSLLFIVLGIILVIGIAGGIYYLGIHKSSTPTPSPTSVATPTSQPTPTSSLNTDETANWKTVTYEKSNFTFKYPTDKLFPDLPETCFTKAKYNIVFDAEFHLQKQNYLNTNCEYGGEDGSEFSVIISTDQTPITISPPEKTRQLKVAGQDATLIYNRGHQGGTGQDVIYFNYQRLKYIVAIPTERSSLPGGSIDPLFDQILATFKFTQQP